MPDFDAAEHTMGRVLARHYPALINRGAVDVGADLGRDVQIPVEQAEKIMDQIGARVKGIIQTQRERLTEIVNTYQDDYEGQRRAIQEAIDTSEARARVISQSETTFAFNSGTALACQSAGVQVQIADGDEDEPCKSVNGTIQEAEWLLANPSGHPNCQRRGFAVPA
jgi:hypothetical protein